MPVRGADSAYAPDDLTAMSAMGDGVLWWGGYIGGPGAYHAWSPSDFARLRRLGLAVLPIWVPTQQVPLNYPADIIAMINAARGMAVPAGRWIALDAEPWLAAWLAGNPTVVAAAGALVRHSGYRLIIYGKGEGWVPSWSGGSWPDSMASRAPSTLVWQFSGSAGSPVPGADADLARSSFMTGLWHPGRAQPTTQPTSTEEEDEMLAVNATGTVIAARSPQGHLLVFTADRSVKGGWSVDDVTDAILAAAPHSGPYLVA